MAKRYIKRKSAVKPITGSIVDTTNIDDKSKNTYSAGVIDDKISKAGGVEVGAIVHINKKEPTPDGWKDVEGENIIVAYPTNGQKVTTAAQSTVMKLEGEYFQKGTGFSIKNGEIVIGEGINNIKISGNIRINDIAAGDVVFGRLYVDSDIFSNIRVVNSTAVNGNRHTFAFSEFVLKVAKGDRIGIALQNNTSGRGSVYSDEYCSYIKVESIDDTKLIEKASVAPMDEKTGHIYDTTNIDNKAENTYSANVIDNNLVSKAGLGGEIDKLPVLKAKQTTTSNDLNEIRESGIYFVWSEYTNRPSGATSYGGVLLVFTPQRNENTVIVQIYFDGAGGTVASRVRWYDSVGWQDWKTLS